MLVQFGSHYTVFRQDRKTNVRTEIAQVWSYWPYASAQAFQFYHKNHISIGLVVRRSAAMQCPVRIYCRVSGVIIGNLSQHLNFPVKQKNLAGDGGQRPSLKTEQLLCTTHMSRSRSYTQLLRRVL